MVNVWKIKVNYINVVGYTFGTMPTDRNKLRNELKSYGLSLDLKGTILLAKEGINVTSVAGTSENVWKFLNFLSEKINIPKEKFDFKESICHEKPFSRFLVRLKGEAISFDFEFSEDRKAAYVEPEDLDDLLDNEDIVLLDTRNDYEIELGTFKNAIKPPIQTFKQFKEFSKSLEPIKNKKIVTFCTGGIRCEKAGTFLKDQGFSNVYQLRGGILRYFEKTNAKNYDGECFVFDKRVSLKKDLSTSDKKLCYGCRSTLMPEDLKSEFYVKGESCPNCYEKKES